jgi:hypothetical protein
MTLVDL